MSPDRFEREWDAISGKVKAVIHEYGDPMDREDAYAICMARCWRKLDLFRGESAFSTWACQVARRVCHDLRKKGRVSNRREDMKVSLSAVTQGEMTYESLVSGPNDVHEFVASEMEARRIQDVIDSLDRKSVAMFRLFLSEKSYEEMAVSENVPMGTVRSRINRGRSMVKERLVSA